MIKVQKKTGKTGTRFTGLYEWAPGVWRSAGTHDSYKKAEKAALAQAALVERDGSGIDPSAGNIRFSKFAEEEWLPSLAIRLKPGSVRDYTTRYIKHLSPHFGDMKLNEINGSVVRHWILRQKDRDIAFAEPLSVLSLILDMARRDGLIMANPVPGMREKPKSKQDRRNSLDRDDFFAVHDEMPGPLTQLIVMVFVATGMRMGELFELRGKDLHLTKVTEPFIRLERNVVRLGPEYTDDGGCFLIQDSTKGHADRDVPVTWLAEQLMAHVEEHGIGPEDLLFPFKLMQEEVPTSRAKVDLADMPELEPVILPKSGKEVPHGTVSAYVTGGCRCRWCRAARAERGRINRTKTPRKDIKTSRKQTGTNTTSPHPADVVPQ